MEKSKYPKYLEKGMKFGKLTVLGLDESNEPNLSPSRLKYLCKCECGEITSVIKTSLTKTKNSTKSCGCLARNIIKIIDPEYKSFLKAGDKFGKLTVIKLVDSEENKNLPPAKKYYLCKCECGNTKEIAKRNLVRKNKATRSCGCIRKNGEHLVNIKYPKYLKKGDTYNRLTVLGLDNNAENEKTNPSRWKYLCKCECGNIVSVRKDFLTIGHTKSCGCYGIDKSKEACRKYNKYEIIDNYVKVWDFNNKYFLMDKEDMWLLKECCWHINGGGYPSGIYKGEKLLHRIVLNAPSNMLSDHKNGNRYDCRKANLRLCNKQENNTNRCKSSRNTSGYKGISWNKSRSMWEVHIGYDGKKYNLGYFDNIEEAIEVRKQAEIKHHKNFSRDYRNEVNKC